MTRQAKLNSDEYGNVKTVNDISKMTISELVELLHEITSEIELRVMQCEGSTYKKPESNCRK